MVTTKYPPTKNTFTVVPEYNKIGNALAPAGPVGPICVYITCVTFTFTLGLDGLVGDVVAAWYTMDTAVLGADQ